MKAILNYVTATILALAAGMAVAAVDQADKMAPEPTVSGVWIVVFLGVFVLFCVGVGIGIYRADKKSKTEGAQKG